MELATIGVEEWLNVNEHDATYDLAQSTIRSLTWDEVIALDPASGEELLARLGASHMNYGWIEGSDEFKELVAGLYEGVRADDVLQMNGCTGANLNAIMALVSPGDHVVAEYPTYASLYEIPRGLGAEVTHWHLREELGWRPDIDELRELVRPDTRLICINNAANPTGCVLWREDVEAIAEVAASVGAWVLSDEVYLPLVDSDKFVSMADVYERSVVTNSVSKTYSLPSARVGWTVSPPELTDKLRHFRDHTMICTGVVSDELACRVLRNKGQVLERNREIVLGNLAVAQAWVDAEPRARWVAPHGISTSYVQLDLPEGYGGGTLPPDEAFCLDLLHETGTLLVPASRFGLPCGARLGYCCDQGTLKQGLDLISQALSRL